MTPEQKLKWAVLDVAARWKKEPEPSFPCDNVDEMYSELIEADGHWDAEAEVRGGDVETGLKCEWSRHYESKAVAMKFPDGSWVGWTYWYGGGKHGEPSSIEWMDDAYDVDCHEEEKMVVVQTFKAREAITG